MKSFAKRLLAAGALYVGLAIAERVTGPDFPGVVSAALVVALVIQYGTAIYFTRKSLQNPHILSLRTRGQDALALALASSAAAAIVVVRFNTPSDQPIDQHIILVLLSFALLMIVAPAVNWIINFAPWRGWRSDLLVRWQKLRGLFVPRRGR